MRSGWEKESKTFFEEKEIKIKEMKKKRWEEGSGSRK